MLEEAMGQQWIFFLSLTAMIAGFVIIGYGVVRVYDSPENLKPTIVVAGAGVLVEFISTHGSCTSLERTRS
jgi:hypothetical protein